MTQDLYTTQKSVLDYLTANLGYPVFATNYPAEEIEPTENGVLSPYAVLRFNDATQTLGGGAVGGARWDELYTLFDVLVVAATEDDARKVAYGAGGVGDVMTGFVPTDGGEMTRNPGGQVFVAGDGSGARPQAFIARVSFRCQVNMVINE